MNNIASLTNLPYAPTGGVYDILSKAGNTPSNVEKRDEQTESALFTTHKAATPPADLTQQQIETILLELQQDTLDTSQNIYSAASAILNFGI